MPHQYAEPFVLPRKRGRFTKKSYERVGSCRPRALQFLSLESCKRIVKTPCRVSMPLEAMIARVKMKVRNCKCCFSTTRSNTWNSFVDCADSRKDAVATSPNSKDQAASLCDPLRESLIVITISQMPRASLFLWVKFKANPSQKRKKGTTGQLGSDYERKKHIMRPVLRAVVSAPCASVKTSKLCLAWVMGRVP